MSFPEKQALLNDLDVLIASHRKIVQHDRLVQEYLERLRTAISGAENEADKRIWHEELNRIAQLVKDLAVEEQRMIEESPATGSNALEEEAHGYFNLGAQLKRLKDRHFESCLY